MKFVIALALVAVVLARPDDLHYDSKYDSFNVDELLGNTRLLKNYANCFNELGKCTSEGNDFKKWMPEGTTTSCAKCTEPQKHLVAKFIKGMKELLPEDWEMLRSRNDPKNEHEAEINEFLAKYA